MNWRGRPVTDHEIVVDLIAATTTHTGLHVQAGLDTAQYQTKINISDTQLAACPLR